MTNTIELLETIGRDAFLRHAAGLDLAKTLDGMGASEGLQMAAASGDRDHLEPDLGPKLNEVVHHVNQNPNNGGCDVAEDDGVGEDTADVGDENERKEIKPGS